MTEKQTLSPEFVAELKAAHKTEDLIAVTFGDGDFVVFKRPSRHAYERFIDTVRDGHKSGPSRELVKSALVYPEESVFDRILEAKPAMLTGDFLVAVQELSGNYEDTSTKKL